MPEIPKPSRRAILAALSLPVLPALPRAVAAVAREATPIAPVINVDFTTALVATDPLGAGITISTYSGSGTANINKSAAWMAGLQQLGPAHCRIPLRWNGGNPGSGAGGALTSGDADTYIKNIKAIGAIPYIVFVGNDAGNGMTAADGAAFVHHYNDNGGQHNGPVHYWVVGNEPDNPGTGSAPYLTALPGLLSAMHGADPTVKLSAPAAAFWDPSLIKGAAAGAVDILSYHAYNGGDPAPPNGDGWPTTLPYYTNIKTMQGYKPGIMYGVEEYNWHSSGGATEFFDWHNALFAADVIGHVLSAGGHATFYADSNGPLSLMNDGTGQGQPGTLGTPLPAWWGMSIWTGHNGAFPKWGTHFMPCTTTYPENTLTAYACDNGKIVVINKDTTTAHGFNIFMKGKTSGSYNTYITDGTSISLKTKSTAYSNGKITESLPAKSAISINVT